MKNWITTNPLKVKAIIGVVLTIFYYLLGKNLILALGGGVAAFVVLLIPFRAVPHHKMIATSLLAIVSPFYFYFLVEILNHHFPWKGLPIAIAFNIIFYTSFLVLGWVITNHFIISCGIVSGLVFVLGTVNYFVQVYRDAAFSVYDIFAFRTAMNVLSGGMELQTDWVMAVGAIGFITYWLFLYKNYYKKEKIQRKVFFYTTIGMRVVLGAAVLVFFVSTMKGDLMENSGVQPNEYHGNEVNGFLVHFIVSYKAGRVEEPKGYQVEGLEEIVAKYPKQTETEEELPNIIVIMNESFSDYRVFDKCTTDKPFMPFIDSLEENTIKGFALASVHGGGTANSEWEFLMGNTMAFMPASSVPYQIYLNDEKSSLTKTLEKKGYSSLAMHPYESSGWNRKKAWQYLGFDESMFIEDFTDYEMLNDKMLDQSNYDAIIQLYEEKKLDNPFFLFDVTIQNHTGGFHDVAKQLGYSIKFTGELAGKNPYEEGYFTLIHESDKAFENLVHYFENQEQKTVIMMYGDHQPGTGEAFLEQVYGQSTSGISLEERLKMYEVPYVIWANYEIEEKQYELTSINYLSSILLDAIGLKGTPYNDYLMELRKEYPAINAFGYYKDETFYEITDYKSIEDEKIAEYQQLQYNNMFDIDSYKKDFFE